MISLEGTNFAVFVLPYPVSVSSVKEYLVKNQLSLYALVNNAGISVSGPLESIDMTKYRHGFEVNFFGPLLMTRAFLPLLRMGQKSYVPYILPSACLFLEQTLFHASLMLAHRLDYFLTHSLPSTAPQKMRLEP